MKMILTDKHRKNIIRKTKKLIKTNVPDYYKLPEGEKEQIQDKYIEQCCIELGVTLANFYHQEGKILDNILNRL